MSKLSYPEVQKKIFDFISKNPGLHLSKISEMLNIPVSIVEQHLLYLERNKLIVCMEEKDYKIYYVERDKIGIQAKKMLEIREIIYDLISKNPGLHLSKIAELMNMRISLTEYHLNYMEKKKIIIATKEGSYYKRYYVKDSGLGERDKKILGLLRQEIPLKIVLFLLQNPKSRHKELLENLGLTTSTLTYHLHKLIENEIVVEPSYGMNGYSIKNRKEITRFLKKYKIYSVVECFKGVWENFNYRDKK